MNEGDIQSPAGYTKTLARHGHRMVPTADIEHGERLRPITEYDLDELQENIGEVGLIHPVVIDNGGKLVAGGRRYTAVKNLGWPSIPVTTISLASDKESEVIEIMENLGRKDMHFVDVGKGLFALRELLGTTIGGRGKTAEGSIRNLAKLAGRSEGSVAMYIRIGGLAQDPGLEEILRQSSSMETGVKIITKLIYAQLEGEQARRAKPLKQESAKPSTEETPGASVDYTVVLGKLMEGFRTGDCIAGLGDMKPLKACFAEVDPPYGIGLEGQEGYNDIPMDEYPEFLGTLSSYVFAHLAEDSFCVWWYAPQWYREVVLALDRAGFKVNPVPACWAKSGPPGKSHRPATHFGGAHENFIVCWKGTPSMTTAGIGRSNVFSFPRVTGEAYTAERPVAMTRAIIQCFVHPGGGRDLVLCPCLGSGNTIIAAYEEGFNCIGWDLEGTQKEVLENKLRDQFGLI